jgi:hypothetical protein
LGTKIQSADDGESSTQCFSSNRVFRLNLSVDEGKMATLGKPTAGQTLTNAVQEAVACSDATELGAALVRAALEIKAGNTTPFAGIGDSYGLKVRR